MTDILMQKLAELADLEDMQSSVNVNTTNSFSKCENVVLFDQSNSQLKSIDNISISNSKIISLADDNNLAKHSFDENISESPPKNHYLNLNKSCDLSTSLSNCN
jgi:hypothetical protein